MPLTLHQKNLIESYSLGHIDTFAFLQLWRQS